MTKSEWSGWAQFLGVMLSIAVVIYLARLDHARRTSDAREVARLRAARVQWMLIDQAKAVDRALRRFADSKDDHPLFPSLLADLQSISVAEWPTKEDLEPLVVLREASAADLSLRVAACQIYLRDTMAEILGSLPGATQVDGMARAKQATGRLHHLNRLLVRAVEITAAMTGFEDQYLEVVDDRPTGKTTTASS